MHIIVLLLLAEKHGYDVIEGFCNEIRTHPRESVIGTLLRKRGGVIDRLALLIRGIQAGIQRPWAVRVFQRKISGLEDTILMTDPLAPSLDLE